MNSLMFLNNTKHIRKISKYFLNISKNYSEKKNNTLEVDINSTSFKSLNRSNNKTCKNISESLNELGQPTFWTHPHLFTLDNKSEFNNQVTPGLTKKEFEERRNNYVNHLVAYQKFYFSSKLSNAEKSNLDNLNNLSDKKSSSFDNFIAIIPSSMTTFMAPDVQHNFRQNSDFLYLTGFEEPNSVLVLSRTGPDIVNNNYKVALFVREKNEKKELWEGPSTGSKQIFKLLGIQQAFPIEEFKNYLNGLFKDTSSNSRIALWRYPAENVKNESGPDCYNDKIENSLNEFVQENMAISNKLIDMIEQDPINTSSAASYFNTSRYFVQLCRLKKSTSEIDIMKKACEISSQAFINSMKIAHPYINEHLIYSKFDFDCRIRGSEYLAYIPVIAGGPRATILHYIRNNQVVPNDNLLLMDAGCSYRGYSSDITRTFPVSGKFNSAQKDLYNACLNVQKYCLKYCSPGISIQQLYFIMMRKLSQELSDLGLIDKKEHDAVIKPTDSPLESLPMFYLKKLSHFCPHDIGHYLGLDVHDCPEISKNIAMEPNTVITIEPGIYINKNDESVPYKYRGIGIRIEDDVVLTSNGCEILSSYCPKEISDIENIMKSS